MTPLVLVIALAHAVPVFLVGVITKNKSALNIAAIIVGLIGIIIGKAQYAPYDLLGVGIAYFLALTFVDHTKATKAPLPAPPSSSQTAADNGDLHFFHVVILCAVGGWVLALEIARQSNHGYNQASFFQLLFDLGFIGMAAAPTFVLCAAAGLGWSVGKLIKPLHPYATWLALAAAFGLFLAMKTGSEIGYRRASTPSTLPQRQDVPRPLPIQSQPIVPKINVAPQSPSQPSLAVRLLTLANELNGGKQKTLGDHLIRISASANSNTLEISLRMNNFKSTDAEAQIPLAVFDKDITRYYCGTGPYDSLLKLGATIVVHLYGKESDAIGSYPITITRCAG
jgi:hypothetical protein